MPSKDISYQVALKLSFCSAATLSEVLGMWPRPFRKLLGREHLSPGITTFPQKAGSHFAHHKMQGFDRRKYHGWWVKHFLVGVQCDYGNGNLYSAFYWMLKPLSKSSYSLLLEHVSAQRSWDLTEALSLSLCKSLSFGETVKGWRRRGWSSASRKYASRSLLNIGILYLAALKLLQRSNPKGCGSTFDGIWQRPIPTRHQIYNIHFRVHVSLTPRFG